jgi:serine/threonine protein kinase
MHTPLRHSILNLRDCISRPHARQSLVKSKVGSGRYLAPERLNPETSSKPYGVRSDVWAYGITLLELAILQYPYGERLQMFEVLHAIVDGVPHPASPPATLMCCRPTTPSSRGIAVLARAPQSSLQVVRVRVCCVSVPSVSSLAKNVDDRPKYEASEKTPGLTVCAMSLLLFVSCDTARTTRSS